MTTCLFKKSITFSDIHFGLKNNSEEHNKDCIDFINWVVFQAKQRDIETCIFMGDWNHHRSNINLLTLDYTMKALKILNDSFEKVYILVGNHDLFYREKRDIHSMIVGSEFSNIELIDSVVMKDNVAFIPWLVNDEWQSISGIKSKYIFGHLELPGFKMNANVEMPDHGKLNSTHFKHQDYVFTGHFHMRQSKGKVHYIGNPFGHNYADAWDFDRGAMILDWDGKPEFLNYEDGPKYMTINLSSLLENQDLYLKPKSYIQVILDVDISYEEASFLREGLIKQYNIREIKLIKKPEETEIKQDAEKIVFKTVDQTVIEQLNTIDSEKYDIKKLIEIYNNL